MEKLKFSVKDKMMVSAVHKAVGCLLAIVCSLYSKQRVATQIIAQASLWDSLDSWQSPQFLQGYNCRC